MNAIFAVNALDGFGTGSDMPWPRSTVDLQRFKELTKGATVVMGNGTWQSDMPKPLPGRRNIVLSTTLNDDRCEVVRDITHLMMEIKNNEQVWVIGGANVLWSLRKWINTVYLTRFNSSDPAVVKLDTARYLDGFKLTESKDFGEGKFETWVKV